MQERGPLPAAVRFGPFALARDSGELRRKGVRLKLSGQAIDVLLVLTANPGRLVTRQELQQQLWPGVDYGDFEHGLNAAVSRLREALGDSARDPEYIETIPQRGYRFIAVPRVEELGPEEGPTAAGPEAAAVGEVTRRKVST
jgi:DNA-binding winged helix-turn-helix (wHTH) protein